MWKVEGNQQILSWQYGRIIICHEQPDYSDGQLITSQTLIQDGSDPSKKTSQANKSMEKTCLLLEHFHKKKMNRSSKLYIKGGGMILDLAGFAASIYMRGIKNITHVPTTLLAMVDGTVGGKTAINYRGVKNLIGSIITSPIDVIIYVPYLYTLPRRQLLNGMAEIIKMAAVYDRQYFQELSSNRITIQDLFHSDEKKRYNTLVDVVKKSLQIKIKVVLQDMTQSKQAKWLSFGHTLGHAMQTATGNIYKHGQSVSVGMIKACQLAYKKGIIKDYSVVDRLKSTLNKFQLPTELPIFYDRNQLVQLMMQDKKNFTSGNSHTIEFVLIEDIGKMCSTGSTKIDKWETYDLICQAVSIQFAPQGSIDTQINQKFEFPGSKDICQRLLFASALKFITYKSHTKISNFLASQCTSTMINALKVIGFDLKIDNLEKQIKIIDYNSSIQKGVLQIGNSGITARFLIPLCCLLEGQWQIQCNPRLAQRSSQGLMQICNRLFDSEIQYLKKKFCLPIKIKTKKIDYQKIKQKISNQSPILIDENNQYAISSILINLILLLKNNGNPENQSKQISIKTKKGNYNTFNDIDLTIRSLNKLGINVYQEQQQDFIQYSFNKIEKKFDEKIQIETDLLSLSNIYVLSKLLQIKEPQVLKQTIQNEKTIFEQINFLEKLKKQFLDQIQIKNSYKIPQFDINICQDTFMALVVLMVHPIKRYQKEQNCFKIDILNVSSQRNKQTNRIFKIIKNLKKIGMKIQEFDDKIRVINGYDQKIFRNQQKIIFQTGQDHRLALAMGTICAYMSKQFPNKKFIIDNKKCIQKTFPGFLNYLNFLGLKIKGCQAYKYRQHDVLCRQNKYAPLIFFGNPNAGIRTIGKKISEKMNTPFVDINEEIIKFIQKKISENIKDNKQFVQKYGWEKYRQVQSEVFQHWINKDFSEQHLIVIGYGIIQKIGNREALKRQPYTIYIERDPKNLIIQQQQTLNPIIQNLNQTSSIREKYFFQVSTYIINIPTENCQELQINYVMNSLRKNLKMAQIQKPSQGYVLCFHEQPSEKNNYYEKIFKNPDLLSDVSALQIRLDLLKQQGMSFSQLRHKIAKFMILPQYQKLPTILSVRTKQQFGSLSKDKYVQMIDNARKMPTDFLDIQIASASSLSKEFHYNFNKIIWTYNGSEEVNIKKLLAMEYGMKKLSLSPYSIQNEKLYQKLKKDHGLDICVLFGERFSRLENKYQMVVPQTLAGQNKTGIYDIHDMKQLRALSKLLGKSSQQY